MINYKPIHFIIAITFLVFTGDMEACLPVVGITPLLRKPTGEGERIASEISQPLIQGLQGLAQRRLQDVAERAQRQRVEGGLMEAMPGLTQESAQALSGLSEKQLSEYIKVQGEQAYEPKQVSPGFWSNIKKGWNSFCNKVKNGFKKIFSRKSKNTHVQRTSL